uniref:Reverse transcriptase Ty1/copia-type domain-containing protein n=1 Tax=Trichuris muris TaxID=70415 RepID=A0A5S6QQ06_TRIMR
MQAHISSMLEVVELLRGAGTEISTGEMIAVLLCSLAESYSGLVIALEGRDETDLSVEYVVNKTLDEYQRRVQSYDLREDDNDVALRVSSRRGGRAQNGKKDQPLRKENRKCFFCKKNVHLKADCEAFRKKNPRMMAAVEKKSFTQEKQLSFATCEFLPSVQDDDWIVDSGSSSHMYSKKQNSSEDEKTATQESSLRRSQRANKGVPPQRLCYRVEAPVKEPSSWEEMTTLPELERKSWTLAAEEEIKSLKDHYAWEFFDTPPGKKAITCKWIFKAKYDSRGRVQTYKARLVATGFSQKYGQDYDEIFAPVVRYDKFGCSLQLRLYESFTCVI